jgi:methionine synthase II (cobalamin-independent)
MQRTVPPFRADHVGSLLRSAALKEARLRRERGRIDAAALQAVEDREIITPIRRQQDVGLTAVTDGEYRRASWQTDVLVALEGVESYRTGVGLMAARRDLP